ncbi:MAG: hypothetical protein ACK59M_12145 [Pseudomonadota bacterium]|jgi:hypothetical protein
MAAAVEGSEVVVRLRHRGGRVLAAQLTLRRPLSVVDVALGRTPADFLRMLGLLFPLCGAAHAVAGLRAIEAAAGVAVDPAHQAARRAIALADALAAHAWRCEFDWAGLAGEDARPVAVAAARRAAESLLRALYPDGDALYPGGGRLAASAALAAEWAPVFAKVAASLRLEQHLIALRRGLTVAMAGADPAWMTRLHARFRVAAAQAAADAVALQAALASLAGSRAGPSGGPLSAAGRGEGGVETARGVLRWRVALRGGLVVEGAPDAPVDRVFGPDGEAERWLAALDHAARPAEAARWIMAALDPCAPLRIEAQEAAGDA